MTMRFPTERHLDTIDDRDKLAYRKLSETILNEIILQMETPNCFGLYGNWGSGKSTILHFILNHINESDETNLIPVYFEPWKYEYAEKGDLIFALLSKIRGELSVNELKWKRAMAELLTVGAWGLRMLPLPVDVQNVTGELKTFQKALLKEYENWVDKTEVFREEFGSIVDRGLPDGKTLLVIIDDLDRCLPDNAVKLLEAMKNFLSVPRTLFVVAIDRRVVAEMIEKKYGLHDGFGEEYLMKIIHYFYELPRSNLKEIVEEFCILYQIPEDDLVHEYMADFLHQFASEPRRAKYFMHQFGMRLVFKGDELREFIASTYTRNTIQHASPLADAFLLSFLMARFPNIFASENPMRLFAMVHERATNTNTKYKDDEAVVSLLTGKEWHAMKAVLRFGFHRNGQSKRSGVHFDQIFEAARHLLP